MRLRRGAYRDLLLEHAAATLDKTPRARRRHADAELAALLRVRPAVLVITHELWQDSCRNRECTSRSIRERGADGPCALCLQAKAIEDDAFSRPWTERAPTLTTSHRWSTVDAALTEWAQGSPVRGSWCGPLLDRARDELGRQAATGAPDDRRQVDAADLALIGRALERAFRSDESRHGVSLHLCLPLVAARVRGVDLTALAFALDQHEDVVRRIATEGRRAVRVELAARGMIPAPRARDGLRLQVARRAEELARRAV